MKLINPSFEIYEQGPGLEGIYEAIERAGRTCYKSTRPEGQTAKDFVDRMIASQHYAMLEHGTVYLKIPTPFSPPSDMDFTESIFFSDSTFSGTIRRYQLNPYSKVTFDESDTISAYITTNMRVLQENNWLDDLKYLCEPTEFHEKRVTVKFTSNIHFYKDITRHRPMSFAIESTRYCNYSKGKFGNELTFIIPVWMDKMAYYEEYYGIPGGDSGVVRPPEGTEAYGYYLFLYSLLYAEEHYMGLIENGWKAQQAAEVLPQATKADIIMTGFVSDWQHIFNLRTSIIAATGQPHPEVSRLMDPLYEEFETRKLI